MYDMAHFYMSAWGIQIAKLQKLHAETLVHSGTDDTFPDLFDFTVANKKCNLYACRI
jgi:hypothetical protein